MAKKPKKKIETQKIETKKLPREDVRLGRLVEHDPRSRAYRVSRRVHPTKDVMHVTEGAVLNQGQLGACVGFSTAHLLNTDPFRSGISQKHPALFLKADALKFYSMATVLDQWPGVYPPNDTGTSGLAAMKALKKLGLIKSYNWAFGIEGLLGAITASPVLVGIPWYSGMFDPDASGRVKLSGKVVGGHEVCVKGFEIVDKANMSNNLFWVRNSWGGSWGKKGDFSITVADMDRLLSNFGDCVIPVVS